MKSSKRTVLVAITKDPLVYFISKKTWDGCNWLQKKKQAEAVTEVDLEKLAYYVIDNSTGLVVKNRNGNTGNPE